ncbi:MAG: patatin-like phospholipase family protein [Bacteroidota bacterium]
MSDKEKSPATLGFKDVIALEKAYLSERRKKLDNGEYKAEIDNWFGIALSGGGIRSATVNLGFLRCLNEHGLLSKADYISTVSGGGYTGSYIQATLKNAADLNSENNTPDKPSSSPFDALFTDERIGHLKAKGNYMTPGLGFTKKWNQLLLVVTYLSSLIMSWIGPLIAIISAYLFTRVIANNFDKTEAYWAMPFNVMLLDITMYGLGALIVIHFILNLVYNYSLDISLFMDKLKGWFLMMVFVAIFIFFCYILVIQFEEENLGFNKLELLALGVIVLLCFTGLFANPNATSLHRYYRKRLADSYLESGGTFKNVELHKLSDINGKTTDYCAPYPLINTCLNLQGGQTDDSFQGAKSGDYFLLSPFYCGSKLTGYLKTSKNNFYKKMTLPTAMAISAAAVNPGMGLYSSPILSIMTTLFNFRLGFWVLSPKRIQQEADLVGFNKKAVKKELSTPSVIERIAELKKLKESGKLSVEDEKELNRHKRSKELLEVASSNPLVLWGRKLVWWPKYFFYELLSGINTKHRMLNISDGGHIENLAVYELLRRRCKLIIAIDAGADPNSEFIDLHNLVVRARNELGIQLKFRKDQIPEEVIKPKQSHGFSRTHFAVADIIQLTEKRGTKGKVGTFVYVKSSVTAPGKKKDISRQVKSYQYKTYHADFPHESTADQFFDEAQWEAYYYLGYFIGKDVLMGRNHDEDFDSPPTSIDDLYNFYQNYKHTDPIYDDPEDQEDFMTEEKFKEFMETKGEDMDYAVEQKVIQEKIDLAKEVIIKKQ